MGLPKNQSQPRFIAAAPVWPEGLAEEKNMHVGFHARFDAAPGQSIELVLCGATIYRVMLNDEIVHHGPARGPHGWFRIDTLDLSKKVAANNHLAIEVAGYHCFSFAYPNQPSFLQAELRQGNRVLRASGRNGDFRAARLRGRIQRVERYGYQRAFLEAYRLHENSRAWMSGDFSGEIPIECENLPPVSLIPRASQRPAMDRLRCASPILEGGIETSECATDSSAYWWMNDPRYRKLSSFAPEEFESDVLSIYQSCIVCHGSTPKGSWALHDLGRNTTGFIGVRFSCKCPVRILLAFDEVLTDGRIALARNDTLNLVFIEAKAGDHSFESMEPYTLRYLEVISPDGRVEVESLFVREFENPLAGRAEFCSSDAGLVRLFEAGRSTFAPNAVDIFMDCPGRERAGWLCDSFFMGRVEPILCGVSSVEHDFLENFALPISFPGLPEGMLPMCYPSENLGGRHIPQWALWFVLELEEYFERTRDRELLDSLEGRVRGILNYFTRHQNSDGLLENLPSWNFIEWSKANDLIGDVSYPTNMLYACALESAANLYGAGGERRRSHEIREIIRQQSLRNGFFMDCSYREDSGDLRISESCSEVCQYMAFFTGTATVERDGELWARLLDDFGSAGAGCEKWSMVYPANAFVGLFLRMELLSRFGHAKILLNEMKARFCRMEELTGTLWEHGDSRASCNHGFASHVCVHLVRDAAGVLAVHIPERELVLTAEDAPCPVDWCGVRLPVPGGMVLVRRLACAAGSAYETDVPSGWRVRFVTPVNQATFSGENI